MIVPSPSSPDANAPPAHAASFLGRTWTTPQIHDLLRTCAVFIGVGLLVCALAMSWRRVMVRRREARRAARSRPFHLKPLVIVSGPVQPFSQRPGPALSKSSACTESEIDLQVLPRTAAAARPPALVLNPADVWIATAGLHAAADALVGTHPSAQPLMARVEVHGAVDVNDAVRREGAVRAWEKHHRELAWFAETRAPVGLIAGEKARASSGGRVVLGPVHNNCPASALRSKVARNSKGNSENTSKVQTHRRLRPLSRYAMENAARGGAVRVGRQVFVGKENLG